MVQVRFYCGYYKDDKNILNLSFRRIAQYHLPGMGTGGLACYIIVSYLFTF